MTVTARSLPIWSQAGVRIVERPVERRGEARAAGARAADRDLIVAEEPLELRIAGESLIVTMRTPGDDLDLAAGLLFTEGVIASMDDVAAIVHAGATAGRDRENVVDVTAARGRVLEAAAARHVLRATAACGLCGKESIAAVRRRIPPIGDSDGTRVPLSVVLGLPAAIRDAQPVFAATGGLHAVGLFTPEGALRLVREDVGRHNAVDKVTGARIVAGLSPSEAALVVSGRAGFELAQKAVAAGTGALVAVGAPTSLAVQLAEEAGLVLYGFTSSERTVRYA